MRPGLSIALIALGGAFMFTSPAVAAPPVLMSVGHVQRHPEASWVLPPAGRAWLLEIARRPETGSDGYFFEESRVVYGALNPTDTHFLDDERLAPGTYFVHVSSFNESCVPACVEWSQILQLVIELPPPPRPRYEASVRSIHPGAVKGINWTYLGDTVRVRFRNANARPSDRQGYRVCYTHNRRLACRNRRVIGRFWDSWRLRILPPWAGFVNGRHRGYVEFTFRVDRRIVARKRIKVFYDV
jgi:hypothetical protein